MVVLHDKKRYIFKEKKTFSGPTTKPKKTIKKGSQRQKNIIVPPLEYSSITGVKPVAMLPRLLLIMFYDRKKIRKPATLPVYKNMRPVFLPGLKPGYTAAAVVDHKKSILGPDARNN